MKDNKKNNYKYKLGSFVKDNGANIGSLGTFAGQAIGGSAGNAISGLGSGIAAGAAFGPIGAGIGGLLGLGGALLGNSKQKQAEELQARLKKDAYNQNYKDQSLANLDTNNENPYGNLIFAKGGVVPASFINIEKGELQIDPTTGKILREYNKINPETGGLYQSHSKGKDTVNNFVSAEPGTFIITKDKASIYKRSIDGNDKIAQNTILQNIKNAKDKSDKTTKMALGSFVDDPYLGVKSSSTGSKFNYNGAINTAMNFAPALLNIGQGLFGKVDQQAPLNPINNPYKSNILNNMPQDISLNPLVNRINRNQAGYFRQIDNTTSSNPIARANKNNVYANTQNQLADVYMQQGQLNNQIRGQRSNIYAGLGSQEMQEQARVQQLNLGIEQSNQANRGAKSNLLSTGLGQLQQTFQNNKMIGQQKSNDALRNKLLYEMFPNLRFYSEVFGGQNGN